jgi:hypothetical protein
MLFFSASENYFDDIDSSSEASFYEARTPVFEEMEDLHWRDIMPIHAQSQESQSEISSEIPAVQENQFAVDSEFGNHDPVDRNLQNVQTGNFFLANQTGSQGQIGQIWPQSPTGSFNLGEGGPPLPTKVMMTAIKILGRHMQEIL